MGCCSSRPTGGDDAPNPTPASPRRVAQQQAVSSETAVNPTASTARRRRSSAQPGAASRQSQDSSHSASRVRLTEHYNVQLLKPKPWASKSRKWNPSSLRRERYEFFETRVTGRTEIWDALRQVAECVRENDLATAQGILDAIGVTLPTGRLEEGGYDEAGNLYRIPNAILSDPTNIQPDDESVDAETMLEATDGKDISKIIEDEDIDKDVIPVPANAEDKGKAPMEKDAIKVKCRLSDRGGPDVTIQLGKTQNIGALIRRIRDEADVPAQARLRVAYLGRMLDENRSLEDQGWKDGQVVNVLVAGVYGD